MIWNVRNFYSNLERVSEEGSRFSVSYLALVVASSLLVTAGLLANSVPVIIGSMCVAPFLGPSRAVCVGWVYKKWRTVAKGLIKQLFGLLAIGSTIAFLLTVTFLHLTPEIVVTPETMARTLPTLKDICLSMFIAISSGAVASFVLVARPKIVSEPYQEMSLLNYPRLLDVTVGIEIAISLIPPASVVGMGLAFGRFELFHQSIALLLVNVWGLDVGGMIVLYLWGVEAKPLQLERKIRKITEKTLNDFVKAGRMSLGVILHSYNKADIYVGLHAFGIPDHTDQSLAEIVSKKIREDIGVSNNVEIIATPVRVYSSKNYGN